MEEPRKRGCMGMQTVGHHGSLMVEFSVTLNAWLRRFHLVTVYSLTTQVIHQCTRTLLRTIVKQFFCMWGGEKRNFVHLLCRTNIVVMLGLWKQIALSQKPHSILHRSNEI
ncbi:hypothetical protein NPIL_129441 [Nephila pilipes]|uniref:Uncharacterized protein n=1 Tax=Nephila pilipes TaxID=299642 RepID=A0A8X6MYV2_NEPPI|nr:hypothetical protein NPIL_129441 [Nephila pilipes]